MVLDVDSSPQDIPSPQKLADALLANAIRLDEGRPEDDISVVVLKVWNKAAIIFVEWIFVSRLTWHDIERANVNQLYPFIAYKGII